MPLLYFGLTIPSNKPAFDKILGYIGKAKAAGGQILIGGTGEYFPIRVHLVVY